jgi:hypothetical protein
MARSSKTNVLDQIAKFFSLLSDAPSYWFTLNTSCDHAFHLSKQLGMDESDYKALLIAGNLARYKGGAFMIMLDKWKSFWEDIISSTCHLTAPRSRPTKKGWYSMGNARLCMSSESDKKVIYRL